MAEVNEKMIGNNHEMIGTEIKMDVIYTPPTTDSPFYETDVKPLDSNSVAISLGNVHTPISIVKPLDSKSVAISLGNVHTPSSIVFGRII